MIRVLIVDDSPLFRRLLEGTLERDPGIQVIGSASSGEQAVERCLRLQPDIITLDVVLPGINGFQVVEAIMARRPTPILVISSLERSSIVFRMLAAGALDVVAKPASEPAFANILARIKQLAVVRSRPSAFAASQAPVPASKKAAADLHATGGKVVVIASSAGGPQALSQVLGGLPAGVPAAVVVVQHIAEGFAEGLARWLDSGCAIPVQLAVANQPLQPGTAVVAPDCVHLVFGANRDIRLDSSTALNDLLRPSADVTLRSAAEHFGARVLAVVLTGMGHDGMAGVQAVKARGGRVVVQDEGTSVVYGMPQAALPFADTVLPLGEIAREIIRFARERSA